MADGSDGLGKMFDVLDQQLNEIAVSDRGTLRGLTQSRDVVSVCDNSFRAARTLLILKTERCPSG
jgi:hypothetical protein